MKNEIIAVAEVPDPIVAGMYEELLRRNNIAAMVQAQGVGYGGWAATHGLTHRIFVMSNLYETARELINDNFGDEFLT